MIWRTRDGGRSWDPLARPENVAFSAVTATGSWALVDGAAGGYRSVDGGRSWRPFTPPGPPGTRPWQNRLSRPGLDAVIDTRTIHVSHDGGRTWHRARLPLPPMSGSIWAVAFADRRRGLAAGEGFGCLMSGGLTPSPLFATTDGGLRWRRFPTPPFAIDALAAAPGFWVATTEGAACGSHGLAISRDGGHDWTLSEPIPHHWDCTPSAAAPETIWLACDQALLESNDGGKSWTQRHASGFPIVAAAAPYWLVGGPPGKPATLWKSGDRGRSFRQIWPAP